jgi:hypothetical protein
MLRLLVLSVFITAMLFSCKLIPKKGNGSENAIARVYDKYLYRDDLSGVIPPGMSKADSIEITAAYINNWVRQELLLKQAEDNLDESNSDFSNKIEQYRNSLIIYAYESELVKQKLDTVVPMTDIEAYYHNNQKNFQLRENIVLASYVILKKDSPLASKVKVLLQSNRESDHEKLETLCQEKGFEYMISDGTWISFADLSRKIPLSVDDQQEFLNRNKYYEVKDTTNQYLVAISAFKSKESASPLNFEIENIRIILLNKRKAELLARMENDLISDAVKRNKYEIYKK